MRSLLPQRKKAVSEMISYTLLIVIAVAASILVFNYLKLTLPKDRPECSDGVGLAVISASCEYSPATTTANFTLSLANKGKFTIDAAFIRVGKENRATKESINSESDTDFYFPTGLSPDSVPFRKSYYTDATGGIVNSAGDYILEIQPVMFDDDLKSLVVCTNAIITQRITCV